MTAKRDIAAIIGGLVLIILCCIFGGCSLDRSGLDTTTDIGTAAIAPPNAHPQPEETKNDGGQGAPESMDSSQNRILETGSMGRDESDTVSDSGSPPDWSCPNGAVYPCATGLCPCP